MYHILVIEDDEQVCEEIRELLAFEGYDVDTVYDGQAGIQHAVAYPPDLIICDIMMPVMNGYDVIEELRSHPVTASIPFIFLTAETNMRDGMRLGADDYIIKPFENDDLLDAIAVRLERKLDFVAEGERVAQKDKERLIHHIAHELRNPLTGMEMATALVERHIGQQAVPHLDTWLASYKSGSNRFRHIIDQMILETRLESSSLNHAFIRKTAQLIPVWTLLVNAVEQGRKFAHENQTLDIQLHVSDDQKYLSGDLALLKHALSEIIANALNFSPADSTISINEWIADDMLIISVTDHGIGMCDEVLQSAMVPFNQPDSSTANKGLGLGLSLANQIIELHGGNLHIASALGSGTSVMVRLPYITNSITDTR